jgi:hypothetical protein
MAKVVPDLDEVAVTERAVRPPTRAAEAPRRPFMVQPFCLESCHRDIIGGSTACGYGAFEVSIWAFLPEKIGVCFPAVFQPFPSRFSAELSQRGPGNSDCTVGAVDRQPPADPRLPADHRANLEAQPAGGY